MKVKDVKASINKIRLIVKGIVNPVNPDDIRSVLVELGIVDKFFTTERIHFPKHFSIIVDGDFIRLQEVTPTNTTYCSDTQYDYIVDAVLDMQERGENFNRFLLPKEVQKTHPEVTSPAILACLHFWDLEQVFSTTFLQIQVHYLGCQFLLVQTKDFCGLEEQFL